MALAYLLEGKGGRCLVLTTLPHSCADFLEILGASTSGSPKGAFILYNRNYTVNFCRSQWPRGLRSAAGRLLRSWVRIPPGVWMFVCCECCVLSGRGLCDELITRSEESYWLWCVVVCDQETSRMRNPWPALGRSATGKNTVNLQV